MMWFVRWRLDQPRLWHLHIWEIGGEVLFQAFHVAAHLLCGALMDAVVLKTVSAWSLPPPESINTVAHLCDIVLPMLVLSLFSFPKMSATYVRRPIFCWSRRKLTLCTQRVWLDAVHHGYDMWWARFFAQFCGDQLFTMIHAVIPDCRWAPLGDKCPQTIHRPAVAGAPSTQNPTIPPREFCFSP